MRIETSRQVKCMISPTRLFHVSIYYWLHMEARRHAVFEKIPTSTFRHRHLLSHRESSLSRICAWSSSHHPILLVLSSCFIFCHRASSFVNMVASPIPNKIFQHPKKCNFWLMCMGFNVHLLNKRIIEG